MKKISLKGISESLTQR